MNKILIALLTCLTFQSCNTTDNPPESENPAIIEEQPISTILDTPIYPSDLSVKFTDDNYDYLLQELFSLWEQQYVPTQINQNDGTQKQSYDGIYDITESVYRCFNDASYNYISYSNDLEYNLEITTKNCELDGRTISRELYRTNQHSRDHIIGYDGKHGKYEVFAQGDHESLISEVFIISQKLGSIFRRSEDTIKYFGADNTYFETVFSEDHQFNSENCPLDYSLITYLNGNKIEDFITGDPEKICLNTYTFIDSRKWTDTHNKLIYKIDITEDNTELNFTIVSEDFKTKFTPVLLDSDNLKIEHAFIYNNNYFSGNNWNGTEQEFYPGQLLNKGIYYMHIQHAYSPENTPNIQVRFQLDNGSVEFIEEINVNTLSEVESIKSGTFYTFSVLNEGEIYFDFDTSSNYKMNIYDKKGFQVYYDFYERNKQSGLKTISLENGQYFIELIFDSTSSDIKNQLRLKSFDAELSEITQISNDEQHPEFITLTTSTGYRFDPVVDSTNYTLEIDESNIEEIVNLHFQFQFKLSDIIGQQKLDIIDSQQEDETMIDRYSCVNNGLITYETLKINNSKISEIIQSENCGINSTPLYSEFKTTDYGWYRIYDYYDSNDQHLRIESAISKNYNEVTYIQSEAIGNFLVRSNPYDKVNYFGANGTTLFTKNRSNHIVSSDECHYIEVKDYTLNGGEQYEHIIDERIGCD
ncbi:hypothetical protein [Marinicellulosiphila megalodicopiae]|uniref:hypothetical protein n=1 Tax=Marinicellulosiphila megalodicopiae TaxID=2724896 RepID=UPI003BB18513